MTTPATTPHDAHKGIVETQSTTSVQKKQTSPPEDTLNNQTTSSPGKKQPDKWKEINKENCADSWRFSYKSSED